MKFRNKPVKVKGSFFNPLFRHCCFSKEELDKAPKRYGSSIKREKVWIAQK